MKKLLFCSLLCISSSTFAFADYVREIKTPGSGTYTICEDGFFTKSCKSEKVKIPIYISKGQTIQVVFLEENRGYYSKFDVGEIKYNENKKGCTLTYDNSGTRVTSKCSVVKE